MFSKEKKAKRKILIIDEEKNIRLLLENFLSNDYHVISKSSGNEALVWLEGNLPDLIICDIRMPDMNGFQFIQNVREGGFTKHTPVLVLSVSDSSKERIECYKRGAQDFLLKPFNPEELGVLIKKNLSPIHYAIQW
jgi:DNA-binding response OmpR family regulator